MIKILIAYAAGVPDILNTCLASLARHDPGVEVDIGVITNQHGFFEALDVAMDYPSLGASTSSYDVGVCKTGSEMHGKLLDLAVRDSDTEFILSLDSDCFPVADGWLKYLVDMHKLGNFVTGILWPWIQPPIELNKDTIEYKIRKYHCYNSTQVACQLIRRDFLIDNDLSYVGARDTGFSILDKVWEKGLKVGGLMPTRCPKIEEGLDPEMNRVCSVIYGDMVYHHGAATRSVTMGNVDPHGFLQKARDRVQKEEGAEWLLNPENSYSYGFDKEEQVAQFKMDSHYASMKEYLLTHDRLFEPSW